MPGRWVGLTLAVTLIVAGAPGTPAAPHHLPIASLSSLSPCPSTVTVDDQGEGRLIDRNTVSIQDFRSGIEIAVAQMIPAGHEQVATSIVDAAISELERAGAIPSNGLPMSAVGSGEVSAAIERAIELALPSSEIGIEVIDDAVSRVVVGALPSSAIPAEDMPSFHDDLLRALEASDIPTDVAEAAIDAALPSSALPSSEIPAALQRMRGNLLDKGFALPSSVVTGIFVDAIPSNAIPSNLAAVTLAAAIPSNGIPSNIAVDLMSDALAALLLEAIPSNAIPSNVLAAQLASEIVRAIPSNSIPSNHVQELVAEAIKRAIPSNAIPSNAIPSNAIATEIRKVAAEMAIPSNAIPSNLVSMIGGAALSAIPSNAIPSNSIPSNLLADAFRAKAIERAFPAEAIPSNLADAFLGAGGGLNLFSDITVAQSMLSSALSPLTMQLDFAQLRQDPQGSGSVVLAGGAAINLAAPNDPTCYQVSDDPSGRTSRLSGVEVGGFVSADLLPSARRKRAGTFLDKSFPARLPGLNAVPDPWRVLDGDYSELPPWWDSGWTVYGRDCGYTLFHPEYGTYAVSVAVAPDQVAAFITGLPAGDWHRLVILRCAGYQVQVGSNSYSYYDPATGRRGGGVMAPPLPWPCVPTCSGSIVAPSDMPVEPTTSTTIPTGSTTSTSTTTTSTTTTSTTTTTTATPMTTVPALVGELDETAMSLLEEKGLHGSRVGDWSYTFWDSSDASRVASQNPSAGTSVPQGSTVTYTVPKRDVSDEGTCTSIGGYWVTHGFPVAHCWSTP